MDSKEYHKNYHKKYYLKNKDKIDLKNKLYAKKYPERMVKTVQKYNKKHQEVVSKYTKKYNNSLEGELRMIKYRSLKKGFETDLTVEILKLLKDKPCFYCGENEKKRGLDRVDNNIGYLILNCVSCCTVCNFMKRTMTKKEFLSHVGKIYRNNFI